MSGLAVRNKNGEKVHYTGTQFDGLESVGTRHLCVRTEAGAAGIKKYGLTSTPLNDKYKALRMRIPDNAGGNSGKEAYIAQRYSTSVSSSSSKTYTASRVSNYVSSTTLRTASRTSLSTYTATRSTVSYLNGEVVLNYTGATPVKTTATIHQYGAYTVANNTTARFSISGLFNIEASSFAGTSVSALWPDYEGLFATTIKADTKTITSLHTTSGSDGTTQMVCSVNFSTLSLIDTRNSITNIRKVFAMTPVTKTISTQYTASKTLSTASSSRLSTGNATRSSAYNTSSSVSTTTSKETHNVNL